MPDLITHVAFTHVVNRPFELSKNKKNVFPFRIILYVGTILPDILTRPWYIMFPATKPWTACLHTPFCVLLVCGLIALFFEPAIQKRVFYYLSIGAALHFFLDSFQHHIIGSNYLLFPFSWRHVGYGLFSPGEIIPLIPLWIVIILIMEIAINLYKKSKKQKNTFSKTDIQ